jgi:hypothetical protein
MMKKKFGIIKISRTMIEDNPEEIMKYIMSRLIILKCEFEYISDCFVYYAYCEDFRETLEGEKFPDYVVVVTIEPDEIKKVKFQEVQKWME